MSWTNRRQDCVSLSTMEAEYVPLAESKHIETKRYFIQDLCELRLVQLQYCPIETMKADIQTKLLCAVKHRQLAESMGLGPTVEEMHTSTWCATFLSASLLHCNLYKVYLFYLTPNKSV